MRSPIPSRARDWLAEPKIRVAILGVIASLLVTFVRRSMPFPPISVFLMEWALHFVALLVFVAVTYMVALRFFKFFLGHEHKQTTLNILETTYYIYITVFMAALVTMAVFPLWPR